MQADLSSHQASSFYFVPLVIFNKNQVTLGDKPLRNRDNDKLRRFFDKKVAAKMLSFYLSNNCAFKSSFYNVVTSGIFDPGNTLGGSAKSGAPPQSVAIENIVAWETRSAWGYSLGRDRKLSNSKIAQGFMREITADEFLNFPGVKITTENCKDFFKQPQNRCLWKEVLTILRLRRKKGEPEDCA